VPAARSSELGPADSAWQHQRRPNTRRGIIHVLHPVNTAVNINALAAPSPQGAPANVTILNKSLDLFKPSPPRLARSFSSSILLPSLQADALKLRKASSHDLRPEYKRARLSFAFHHSSPHSSPQSPQSPGRRMVSINAGAELQEINPEVRPRLHFTRQLCANSL
jgi:hypothetical protein